jgi:hypothetical protein
MSVGVAGSGLMDGIREGGAGQCETDGVVKVLM